MARRVLLLAEHRDGIPKRSAFELVSAARGLGEVEIAVLALGPGSDVAAAALAGLGSSAFHIEALPLAGGSAEAATSAIVEVARRLESELVLMAASRRGQSVGPRVAVRLDAALLEDVIAVEARGDAVVARRYSYLARVTETVRADGSPVVVSVKPNVFTAAAPMPAGHSEALEVEFRPSDDRVIAGERVAGSGARVALEEAATVVAGGRGVGSEQGFAQLVLPLAEALKAGVGATRAVVDAGWRPYGEQIGQTGKTVAPDLYVALGISGAVQHLSGMNRSKVVVAINKDADAPIFRVSDYGIVGDVAAVVPALIAALAELED